MKIKGVNYINNLKLPSNQLFCFNNSVNID